MFHASSIKRCSGRAASPLFLPGATVVAALDAASLLHRLLGLLVVGAAAERGLLQDEHTRVRGTSATSETYLYFKAATRHRTCCTGVGSFTATPVEGRSTTPTLARRKTVCLRRVVCGEMRGRGYVTTNAYTPSQETSRPIPIERTTSASGPPRPTNVLLSNCSPLPWTGRGRPTCCSREAGSRRYLACPGEATPPWTRQCRRGCDCRNRAPCPFPRRRTPPRYSRTADSALWLLYDVSRNRKDTPHIGSTEPREGLGRGLRQQLRQVN